MNSYLSVPPLFSCFHFVSQLKQVGILEVLKSLQKLEIHFVVLNILYHFNCKRKLSGSGRSIDMVFCCCLGQLDEFGIATGAEREELEAKREVWNLLILLTSHFAYRRAGFSFFDVLLVLTIDLYCRVKSDLILILLVDHLEPM